MDRILRSAIQRRSIGFTVIEILVAMALTTLVFALLWNFLVTSRQSEEQLATGFSAQQDLALAMQRLAFELQEGTEIFFPQADGTAHSGVAFVSAAGTPIAFYLEPNDDGGPQTLYRVNLTSKKKKRVASNVSYFKVSVEPPATGKKACLASINLSVLRAKEDVAGKADDYNIVKKVFLRNLKLDTPE